MRYSLIFLGLLMFPSLIKTYPIRIDRLRKDDKIVYLIGDYHSPRDLGDVREQCKVHRMLFKQCKQAFAASDNCRVLVEVDDDRSTFCLEEMSETVDECFDRKVAKRDVEMFLCPELFYNNKIWPSGTSVYSIEHGVRFIWSKISECLRGNSRDCLYTLEDFFNAVDGALECEYRDELRDCVREAVDCVKAAIRELCGDDSALLTHRLGDLYRRLPRHQYFFDVLFHCNDYYRRNEDNCESQDGLLLFSTARCLQEYVDHCVELRAWQHIHDESSPNVIFVFAGAFHVEMLCSDLVANGYEHVAIESEEKKFKVEEYFPGVESIDIYKVCDFMKLVEDVKSLGLCCLDGDSCGAGVGACDEG